MKLSNEKIVKLGETNWPPITVGGGGAFKLVEIARG
jgi:hypothetical protein